MALLVIWYTVCMKTNEWDTCYEEGRSFAEFSEILLERIVLLAKKNDTNLETALDIGCGTGGLVNLLATYLPGTLVEGIDFSETAIKIAKEKYPELTFSVSNIESDRLEKKWGIITCNLVYAFIENKKYFLEKVKDHLDNKGIFILNTPVLFEGKDYNMHENSISVDFVSTAMLLSEVFPGYALYNESFNGKFGSRNTWLLAHNSELISQ